jgi:hypothetical protein
MRPAPGYATATTLGVAPEPVAPLSTMPLLFVTPAAFTLYEARTCSRCRRRSAAPRSPPSEPRLAQDVEVATSRGSGKPGCGESVKFYVVIWSTVEPRAFATITPGCVPAAM